MNIVYFDLETQNTFDEVGGRNNMAALKLACGVTWSTARNEFAVYWEKEIMKGSGLWVNTGGRAWDIVLSMQS